MLRVTIDLVPSGYEPLRRTIATMIIGNMSDLADFSNYRIEVMEAENKLTSQPPRSCVCEVLEHDRRQSVWALIEKAAEAALTADYVKL
jgi:hypothetical protein